MKPIKYRDLPERIKSGKYSSIVSNWHHSVDVLMKLNKRLTATIKEPHLAIAVAGSLGRLDACPALSDFDYLVLADDPKINPSPIQEAIVNAAKAESLLLPNPKGAFARPVFVTELIADTGSQDENLLRMAQRLLLLMESQPLYNEEVYRHIIDKILRHYLQRVIDEPDKEALFMLNDIIRYFRSICVNYEFNFWKDGEKWGLRYIKLLHSRLLMYAGLLFLVLNASKPENAGNKYEYLSRVVYLPPIEKLLHVYQDNRDLSSNYLLSIYDIFLGHMNSQQIREQLKIDFPERYDSPSYLQLRVNGDALRKELARFVFARRGQWSDSALEYLLF